MICAIQESSIISFAF